ncbi:hypothetical protein CUA46_23520, partial [Shigella boydii]
LFTSFSGSLVSRIPGAVQMVLHWDGNQRQAKMLSARFRCIFWDNGWFGGGTGNALQSDLAENTGTR